jgi:4-aminobutyrate aminotransferase-like enzyme
VLLAEKLTSIMPSHLTKCVFVNSGSEANDTALRMAHYFKDRKAVICLEYAYHGSLSSLIPISEYKYKNNLKYCEKHVYKASLPYVYQNPERDLKFYEDEMQSICQQIKKDGFELGAFIHESFPSCGG